MRAIEFPYTLYKGLPVPILPVQLQNRGEWFDLWAFVDSGATFSVFAARLIDAAQIQRSAFSCRPATTIS